MEDTLTNDNSNFLNQGIKTIKNQNEKQKLQFPFTFEDDKGVEHTNKCKILFFPHRQIASISMSIKNSETGEIETKVKQGMNKEEIEEFFMKGKSISVNLLIRSIIYEAFIKEGTNLEPGNVRHFWYTHLKPVLLGALKLEKEPRLQSAWDDVIKSGAVTYEGMNIIGGKEVGRKSIVKDSPFSNIIIAVEKQDFFDIFKWIPQLFNCTLITSGGSPSRAVSRRFIFELRELGVDLNQQFYMCVASDLDPHGYYIQEAFQKQLELAIQHYGGTGTIDIKRLFVRKDQVTNTLIITQAIRWKYPEGKMKETIWEKFCEKTDGGLYLNEEKTVRAILEMDAFSNNDIEQAFVDELLTIIKETSDETKIMIPEIMRILDEQRKDVGENVYSKWYNELIQPLIKEFEEKLKDWENEIETTKEDDEEEINEQWADDYAEKDEEKRVQEPELYAELYHIEEETELFKDERDTRCNITRQNYDRLINELYRLREEKLEQISGEYRKTINDLEEQHNFIEVEIDERCNDINEEIERLEQQKDDDLKQVEDDYNFRIEKFDEFKEDHLLTFNPTEETLKEDIAKSLNPDNLPIFFREIEVDNNIQTYIAKLLIRPDLLLDDGVSCFEHEPPTFKGERLLEKASQNKDLNIGKVRDAFSYDFIVSMYRFIKRKVEELDLKFEAKNVPEMKDLEQEIDEAKKKCEDEV